MRLFPGSKSILIFLVVCSTVPLIWAASVDQKILSLVPPDAQAVARIAAPTYKGNMSNFVVITRQSSLDLSDMYAFSNADSELRLREVVFVATADGTGKLHDHTLLASGNFNRERIYSSARNSGATVIHYRGITVLVVQPFARELGELTAIRWLAVPDSEILLFGSAASVQQELDRYLTRSVADPKLVARLARLRRDDETWSVLSLPVMSPEIREALAIIDPQLAARLTDGDAFQFGIRYGKHVEFEYEITTASSSATHSISDLLARSLAGPERGSALLNSSDTATEDHTARGVIKVSMARYNAWLTEVAARSREASGTLR